MNEQVKPEHVDVAGRVLPICKHASCLKHKIWNFDVCWAHLGDDEKNQLVKDLNEKIRTKSSLKNLVLSEAEISGFDFSNLDLSGSLLSACNLKNSKFIDANLNSVHLGGANLSNSDLTRTKMKNTVLSGSDLSNAKILAYSIRYKPINITMNSFGNDGFIRKAHINEDDPYFSEATYQALKSYFSDRGDYDSCSWASYRERHMQNKVLWIKKSYSKWFSSKFFDVVCGYGEKPLRPLIASIFSVLIYAFIYKFFGIVSYTDSNTKFNWLDSLYFSFATFCGYTFPDIIPNSDPISRLFISSEAFLGIFALGLFIFTLSKRFVAR